MEDAEAIGLVRRATLLRAKYRIQREKILCPLTILGVHPLNRAGVYPMGDTVVNLGLKILLGGFSAEEANHEGVCVQELPAPEQVKDSNYETYEAYNKRKCAAVAAYQTCFAKTHGVAYGTLSHSHLLLVLNAMTTGAKWAIPEGSKYEPLKKLQTKDGRWDVAAVAAKDTAFQELFKDGLQMEVLSWKIYTEVPEACSIISQALNKSQQLGLRTSEITALKSLATAVSAGQAMKEASLTFEWVQARVRDELDVWVDDPEFVDLFDFVVTMGGKKAGFVDELLEFAERFVDPKQRQLRLAAFAVANKMPMEVPRAKVAVIMRAYRKPPSKTWCPCPESFWTKASPSDLAVLEQLLHYFHGTCKEVVAALPSQNRAVFLANVNCLAAETFASWSGKKQSEKTGKLKGVLLQELKKFHDQLAEQCSSGEAKQEPPKPKEEWINFASVAANAPAAAAAKKGSASAPARILPRVIEYDAETGKPTTKQDERAKGSKDKASVEVVPWKEWAKTERAQNLDKDAAAHAAICLVLRAHHVSMASQRQAVEIVVDSDNKKYARAECALKKGSLKLYPCAPKQSKFLSKSDHPGRAVFRVRETPKDCEPCPQQTYFVNPELKLPELRPVESAVADQAPGDVGAGTAWHFTGDETLYPFWAVSRVTDVEMKKLQSVAETSASRFNMEYDGKEFAAVAVGDENLTLHVSVPVMTNSVALRAGERLFLLLPKPPEKKRAAETWKTDAKKAKLDKDGSEKAGPKAKPKAKGKDALEVASTVEI